jgi:hypothetical protein
MAPWDEPSSRTCYDSKMAFLQMEKEKVANKAAKEMMNRIKELFPSLDDEDLDETFDEEKVIISALPFDEDIQAFVPPAHREENMMSCNPFEDLDDTLFRDFGN